MSGYIYDKEYNEYYVPEQDQCALCVNEAEINNLCISCWEDEDTDTDAMSEDC